MTPFHITTPIWASKPLSAALGASVLLKMEALQPVGFFTLRGMGRACQASYEAGATHLICSSGGNAGYAVAYAGRKLGVDVTVVVPKTTPNWMRQIIRRERADVVEHGESWDDAHVYASKLAREDAVAYIHPFDDSRVWSGHASIIEEVAGTGPKPGIIVISVGGAAFSAAFWTDFIMWVGPMFRLSR